MLDKKLFKAAIVESKEFDFPTGKAKLHFKALTSAEANALYGTFLSKNLDDKSESCAWAIKQSLCNPDGSQVNEDGTPVITLEQARQLKNEPFHKILSFIFELNSRDDTEK